MRIEPSLMMKGVSIGGFNTGAVVVSRALIDPLGVMSPL